MVMIMVLNSTFNNIVVVNIIGGGSWSTWRTPSTCRKLLCTPRNEQDSNSQL